MIARPFLLQKVVGNAVPVNRIEDYGCMGVKRFLAVSDARNGISPPFHNSKYQILVTNTQYCPPILCIYKIILLLSK